MPTPNFDVAQAHRYFAIECNNAAWDWLESDQRTADQIANAIHTAEASCFHWNAVGQLVNRLRAAYLLANVYAVAKQPENADRACRHCDALLQTNDAGITDWDRAFVIDAWARTKLAAGDATAAESLRKSAHECGSLIADADCREAFEKWHQRS